MAAAPPRVKPILGTMTFGNQSDRETTKMCLRKFLELAPDSEADTARMYTHGGTETLLGELFEEDPTLRPKILATKVNPFAP